MKNANIAVFVPNIGCPHKCSFCDQREIAYQEKPPSPEDVEKTARKALDDMGESAKNAEIAFFGGSFTAIEQGYMTDLLKAAHSFVGSGGFKGIRISTRPDAIDANILTILKKYGVTAIELGAQSMDDEVLRLNLRGHCAHDVRTASALIKAYGFELGLQMMTGLYGSSRGTDVETARSIAALLPKTVRIYPTITIENTLLARFYDEGRYNPPSLNDTVSLCAWLLMFFRERDIKVIRLGLHASPGIEKNYRAGPWHPALRELCEGEIYRDRAAAALEKLGGCRSAVLYVSPKSVSKLAGQHRCNIISLEYDFHCKLKIRTRDLPEYTVESERAAQI